MLTPSRALDWETTRVERKVAASDETVVARFPFTNQSNHSVSILSVHTDCDCTKATASKDHLAGSETATITAVFAIGERRGHQRRHVFVTSDDSPDTPVSLTLDVVIAPDFVCQPNSLTWTLNGKCTTKSVDVASTGFAEIQRIDFPNNAEKRITVSAAEVHTGHRFRLWLTPLSTSEKMQTVLRGTAYLKDGKSSPLFIYVFIR